MSYSERLNEKREQDSLSLFIVTDEAPAVLLNLETAIEITPPQMTPKNERFFWEPNFSALFCGLTKLPSNCNGDFHSKMAPKKTQKMGSKIFTNCKYHP